MKTIHFKSVILFSSLFLLQCNNETEKHNLSILESASSGFTIITGYINNRDVYPNTKDIIINVSHISGQDRVTQIKSPINDDGTFYFEIDLARPQDVTMQPYLDFLYLLPGDSLHIEVDFKKPMQAQISGGKSAEINRDFYKYFNATFYRTTNYRGVGTDCAMNCSWDEIMKKMEEERNDYRNKRQAFLQEANVCDEVVFLTEAMIELDYYRCLVHTMWRHGGFHGKEAIDKEVLMNELNEVATKYFNNGLFSNSHFAFISSAYMNAAGFITQPSTDTNFENWIKEVAKTDIIRDFMFTVMAGSALVQRELDYFEKYSEHVNNEYLLDRLMQEYRTVRANMNNPENISSSIIGNPKDFTDNISLEDKNLLAKIIAPNYGKVHVINIGAAWCAPCKPVLEQLVTLKKEHSEKDVCVSFICISGDNEGTRAMYREKGIDDTSVYFTSNDEYHFFSKNFFTLRFSLWYSGKQKRSNRRLWHTCRPERNASGKDKSTFRTGQIDKMTTFDDTKRSAYNWRFGASGGVAPRKEQWEIER